VREDEHRTGEAHLLWAAGETEATEAARSVAPGEADPEPGAGTRRDARTRKAGGEAALPGTKRDTGRGSTSASTGWPKGWSDSKKRCASCAAVRAGVPAALKN
jgi:hypothetical protein